jgi:hypothetical protein
MCIKWLLLQCIVCILNLSYTNYIVILFINKKLPLYTMAGFDITTHNLQFSQFRLRYST